MFIDSDKDVGLNYLMPMSFEKLKKDILNIEIPGESKTYEPHTTVYYAVTQQQTVQDYLDRTTLDNKPFLASHIGIGILRILPKMNTDSE